MNDLLRKFIRESINEAAKTVTAASGDGLALFIDSSSSEVELSLYNPDKILAMLPVVLKTKDRRDMMVQLKDVFSNAMVGTVTASPPTVDGECNGAWEVISSAAVGGYGPMLYDIVMSMTPNKTLMADRNSVSDAAKGVWHFYFNNRKDVKSKPLDDINDPKTPDPSDDCGGVQEPEMKQGKDTNPLNYSYSGTKAPSGRELNRKHEEFVDQAFAVLNQTKMTFGKATQVPANKEHVRALLRDGSLTFFSRNLRSGG